MRMNPQALLQDKARWLTVLLRLEGAIEMLAFIAAVMPFRWMALTHRWLGMGELPEFPLLNYLVRSVSILYGFHGVLLWLLATDVRRYRPLIMYATVSYLVAALAITWIDWVSSMPWWWGVGEAGSVLWLGLILLWLVWKLPIDPPSPHC